LQRLNRCVGQHFNKNFRLHHVFLQEITENTNKTLLKFQNDRFSTMSTHSCNQIFKVISHIYTLFQCCLFNLRTFRPVLFEFWFKTRSVRKLLPAPKQRGAQSRSCRVMVAKDFLPACSPSDQTHKYFDVQHHFFTDIVSVFNDK
jgi:hypothetical protein